MRLLRWVIPAGCMDGVRRWRRTVGAPLRLRVRLVVSDRAWNGLVNSRLDLLPPDELARIGVVVDVGANVGNWTANVLDLVSPDKVLAVEAAPVLAAMLRERYAGDPRVEVMAAAVAEYDGEVEFHLAEHSHSSSVLRPAESAPSVVGPAVRTVDTVTVRAATLDVLLREIREVSLLKVDVQGYERQVLAGGPDTLKKTRFLLIEANFVHQYEGDALFPELHELVTGHGFNLVNCSQPLVSGGRALFSDALYRRG